MSVWEVSEHWGKPRVALDFDGKTYLLTPGEAQRMARALEDAARKMTTGGKK